MAAGCSWDSFDGASELAITWASKSRRKKSHSHSPSSSTQNDSLSPFSVPMLWNIPEAPIRPLDSTPAASTQSDSMPVLALRSNTSFSSRWSSPRASSMAGTVSGMA